MPPSRVAVPELEGTAQSAPARYNPLLVQCQLCERTFRNRSGLTQHHNVAHASERAPSAVSRLPSPAQEPAGTARPGQIVLARMS